MNDRFTYTDDDIALMLGAGDLTLKGGSGSGNFGHAGRPGKVGGSATEGASRFRPGKAPGVTDKLPSGAYKVAEDYMGVYHPVVNMLDIDQRVVDVLQDGLSEDWTDASDDLRGEVKESIVIDLASRTGLDEEYVNGVVRDWAGTSNDSTAASEMQWAAMEEFGVELSDWQKKGRILRHGDDLLLVDEVANKRKLLQAMYQSTQVRLQAAGLSPDDEVTLYRGLTYDYMDIEPKAIVDYKGNAIESWSASPKTAYQFASSEMEGTGVMISMKVPVRNIVSTSRTGLGCLTEAEIIIFGSIPGSKAEVVTVDQYDEVYAD